MRVTSCNLVLRTALAAESAPAALKASSVAMSRFRSLLRLLDANGEVGQLSAERQRHPVAEHIRADVRGSENVVPALDVEGGQNANTDKMNRGVVVSPRRHYSVCSECRFSHLIFFFSYLLTVFQWGFGSIEQGSSSTWRCSSLLVCVLV